MIRTGLRAAFDTNVLATYVLTVRHLLTHRPPIATLIDVTMAQEEIVLVTAPELLGELDGVLRYPRLQAYTTEEGRRRLVALLLALSELAALLEENPRICRDPDDDRVIACAVVGEADVMVSGDEDLLGLGELVGLGGAMVNPHLLIRPFMRR